MSSSFSPSDVMTHSSVEPSSDLIFGTIVDMANSPISLGLGEWVHDGVLVFSCLDYVTSCMMVSSLSMS